MVLDPDMLEVGNGGMTTEEYRSHFSIWALAKVYHLFLNTFFLIYYSNVYIQYVGFIANVLLCDNVLGTSTCWLRHTIYEQRNI